MRQSLLLLFKKQFEAYLFVATQSSSIHYSVRHALLVHTGRLRHYTHRVNNYCRVDQPSNVPFLTGNWPVNDMLVDAVSFCSHKPHQEVCSVQIGHCKRHQQDDKNLPVAEIPNFLWKQPVSIFALLQDIKAVCDTFNLHKGVVMSILKHGLTSPVGAVIEARIGLLTGAAKWK